MALPTPESLAKNHDEHGEQTALFQWAALNFLHEPRLRLMFAIPNGGERNKVTAARLVAEGVRSGVPDVFLPVPCQDWTPAALGRAAKFYAGLFIEMKKPAVKLKRSPVTKWDTGGVSDKQDYWLTALEGQGYKCVVCYSWEEAANEIVRYLTGNNL